MARLITFDGLSIPNGEITESLENIENIFQAEAGNDLGNTVWLGKLTLNVTLKCDGHMKELIEAKGRKTKGVLEYKGKRVNARLRVSGSAFEKHSEKIIGTDGLWTMTFAIVQMEE